MQQQKHTICEFALLTTKRMTLYHEFFVAAYTYLGIFRVAVNFPFIAISNAIQELFT